MSAPSVRNARDVLLIQTAFLGDVILTTPMITAFKQFFPGAKLSVMVTPAALPLLENHPDVTRVLVIDKKGRHRGLFGMLRLAREIRESGFDLLLAPHQSHRTSFLAWRSGIPRRFGYATAGMARRAYTDLLERPMDRPEIHRLLQFLRDAAGVKEMPLPDQLTLYESDAGNAEAAALLKEIAQGRPILVAPSSVWPTKCWTPHGFARLAGMLVKRYRAPVYLIGSPADGALAGQIQRMAREFYPEGVVGKIHNVCGRTGLSGLYSLMLQSRLLVSNDSSPVHFGCAARIPVVCIMGATTPSLGYAPIARGTTVAQLEDLECRPCGTHGARVCPLGHFRCMKELSAEDVMKSVEKVMGDA